MFVSYWYSRCEKLRTPKTSSSWQWVSWCSRCEHIHTPESRHHRRHALLHPRRDLHPPGFLCQAQNEIKVLPAPNRYVPTIMSTETAFYRRNCVISSVCPGKRTSAGQNSFDKTHWKKNLQSERFCVNLQDLFLTGFGTTMAVSYTHLTLPTIGFV